MDKQKSSAQAFDFERPDLAGVKSEAKELLNFINRQVFNQIPSVSAFAGLLVGAWVVSNFTASPIKGTLAQWGLIEGGTHVVSSGTYKFLSVALPLIATGVTAYIVQKGLKAFREMQLELNQGRVARLGEDVQAEINAKLAILEKAREAGLVSLSEYQTKTASLYQSYVGKKPSKVEGLIINKITNKIQ